MSSAITTLYIEHVGELRRFLARRLSCIEVAAELAHETFARYLVLEHSVPLVNPRAFLYRIAGNLAIDYLRAHRVPSQQIIDLESCSDLPADELSPERYVIARQQLDCLRRAIEDLPPKCREIFIRHKFDGIPQAKLAQDYQITLNAIEKHLVRALIHLRLRVMSA